MKLVNTILILLAIIMLSCTSKSEEFNKHNRLAQMYASSDSLEKAIEEWQLAIKADPDNKLSPGIIDNIMNAKNKLKAQNEYFQAVCHQNMAAIETAAAVGYANNAIAGNAKYPTKNELVSTGLLNEFPKCPSGGVYTYHEKKGVVTCSIHKR